MYQSIDIQISCNAPSAVVITMLTYLNIRVAILRYGKYVRGTKSGCLLNFKHILIALSLISQH